MVAAHVHIAEAEMALGVLLVLLGMTAAARARAVVGGLRRGARGTLGHWHDGGPAAAAALLEGLAARQADKGALRRACAGLAASGAGAGAVRARVVTRGLGVGR